LGQRGRRVLKAYKVTWELRVHKDLRGYRVRKVLKEMQDLRCPGIRNPKVHRVSWTAGPMRRWS